MSEFFRLIIIWQIFYQQRPRTNDRHISFNMQKSSGSSSRLVFLKTDPNFVSLTSSGKRLPSASLSSVIVLNLYILNIFSSLPGLGCLNNTGLPSLIRTRMNKIRYSQLKTIRNSTDNTISNSLFKYRLYNI